MLNTIWAVVRKGKIELLEPINLHEGQRILVTLFSEAEEDDFWLQVSQSSLAAIWDNTEDDIYAELLQE